MRTLAFFREPMIFVLRSLQKALHTSACCLIAAALFPSISTRAAEQDGIRASFSHFGLQSADESELLLGELNCTACHDAESNVKTRPPSRQGPLLGAQGIPLTAQYIRRFLSNPDAFKPGTTMPDMLHGLDATERSAAVDALVHFLLSEIKTANAAPVAADEFKIQQGRVLYHQVGCVGCHAPQEPPSAVQTANAATDNAPADKKSGNIQALASQSIPLGDLARKTTVEGLARLLRDPVKVRPSGRMPSLNLNETEATAIAMYLLRDQASTSPAGTPPPKTHGLAFQYFEGNFKQTSDLEKQKPKSSGLVERFGVGDRKNKQFFGLRFTGVLTVPQDGNYTFYTDSDDGSRLSLDGQLVVQNDGIHGPTEQKGSIDLKGGEHPILVTFLNEGSGASLKVSYSGPGISKREIPPSVLFTYGG